MSGLDAGNLAVLWGLAPEHGLGNAEGRIGAAIWTGNAREIWGNPDPNTTVIGLGMNAYDIEIFKDRKLVFGGRWQPGRVQIMEAGVEPRAVMRGNWRMMQVYVPTGLFSEVALGNETFSPAKDLADPLGHHDEQLSRLLTCMAFELQLTEGRARLAIDGLGLALVNHLIRRWNRSGRPRPDLPPSARHARDWRVRRAIEYLEARVADDVGLDELAAAVDVSPSHLLRVFRQATGVPPHRWLMQRRVEHARAMLADPRLSVTEVAHACGFASSQHFATAFRRHMGATPSDYRRERLS